jgi:hypothetical protein
VPERETNDIYGNAYVPPDGSGYEDDDFDGESLVGHLLGYDE